MPFALFAGPIFKLFDDVITRIFPDKTQAEQIKAQFQAALLEADVQTMLSQMDVNKQEAASNSLFVAGWRPFVGWCCGAAFAYTFILQPFAVFAITSYSGRIPPIPNLDMSALSTVLMGMLGLAGMRTYEKIAGNGNGNGKSNGH